MKKLVFMNTVTGEVVTMKEAIRLHETNIIGYDCWEIVSNDKELYRDCKRTERRNTLSAIKRKIRHAIDFLNRLPINEQEIRNQYLFK